MAKIMETFNKLSLPAVILIASVVLGGFYFASQVIKQKSIDKQLQFERLLKVSNQKKFESCLDDARTVYDAQWTTECKAIGMDSGCTLPNFKGLGINNTHKENKDECIKKYPQNK